MSTPTDEMVVDEKVVTELNEQEKMTGKLEDTIAHLARQLLVQSQTYKQVRMLRIAEYERAYNNDVLPKLRQLFNVSLPIFSGMIDELLAMFNDQVQIKFNATNPSQYLVTPKLQAHWNAERDSTAPNAMWNYKARTDRFNAVLSGRGIFKEYAKNDPEYKNVLEVVNYSDFHCEPMGGGILEKHLFAGTEGNYKTKYELMASKKYNQEQVKKLTTYGWSDRLFQDLDTTYGTQFARWRALGLNPEGNSFTGEPTYNLCDFIVTYNGVRYNVVFEPCSGIWVYCKRWTEDYPSGLLPYKSYATHEDDKNFWSKSYADDLYPVGQSVITLFNQELTNREKQNFNSRAFDKDMFTDVAKLDAAQYRPDSLVPADTMGGTKQIANGIYAFKTPELQGTVDLISWISEYTGSKTGAEELPPKGTSKASVAIQISQKTSKRVGLRSDSWKECYAQLGLTFIEGMREYMPSKISIQVIGENGFIEEQELKRIEVRRAGNIGISITSSTEQESQDAMKKDGRMQAIKMVTENQNLSKYEKETIYRDIGNFDEAEIALLLDTQGSISKKQIAHASQAIQAILTNKKPEIYYGADISYLNYFQSYIIDNKNHVEGKEKAFGEFLNTMAPIIKKNMMDIAKNTPPPPPDPNAKPAAPGGAPEAAAPAPAPKLTVPAVTKRAGQVA